MNLELDQLRALLREYKTLCKEAAEKYDEPEYLAWISATFAKEEWPTKGEFFIARSDPLFRKFRAKYMECRLAMQHFQWDIMPSATRISYQQQWVKETGGVPF